MARRPVNPDLNIDRRFIDGGPPNKKRNIDGKSVFSRLSGIPGRYGDEETKPKLSSRVIKEQPTREDIVAAQCSDEQSKARNRRIFGSLLGTLQKFCQEESRLKSKEEKKAQIEKKLDEKQKKEREVLRKEKQNLFTDRRRQQLEIRAMELKMLKMKDLAAWEATKRPLAGFIRTKARPHLYYLPKVLNQKSQDRLKRSKEDVDRMIEKKRQQVQEEISAVESRLASDIRSLEKNGDLQISEDKDRNENDDEYDEYETEVSFVDHNNSNVAFEVDYDGADDHHVTTEEPRPAVVKQEKNTDDLDHSNSLTSIVIKKERTDDDEDSHSPNNIND